MDGLRDLLNFHLEAGPIHLVAWELLYVVALLLVLSVILNRFLFRPVTAVLDARAARLQASRSAQEAALAALEEKARKHASLLASARHEAAGRLDAARREADAVRRQQVEEARRTAEGQVRMAHEAVAKAARHAEQDLKVTAAKMARDIASAILGRQVA